MAPLSFASMRAAVDHLAPPEPVPLAHRPGQLRGPDPYRTRMMATLAASLVLVLALFNLPLHPPPHQVGWQAASLQEHIPLQELREQARETAAAAPPVTILKDDEADEGDGQDAETAELQPEPEPEAPSQPAARPSRMQAAVLEFTETMPQIVGGIGAYYINIDYPAAAQQAGIQGRLVLTFIVEPDGRPTEIQVSQPLHALLDSAAVRALRDTRFVPGRHGGELVRVRMRLPVRFRLVDRPTQQAPAPADGDETGASEAS